MVIGIVLESSYITRLHLRPIIYMFNAWTVNNVMLGK